MRSMRLLAAAACSIALVGGAAASPVSAASNGSSASCAGAVSWTSASRMVGRTATVKGPVVGAKYASYSNGRPTFLDLGRSYPSSSRFTVVIWGENRGSFGTPERRYYGRTICVRGLVSTYQGLPQIIARSPSQIALG